MINEALSYIAQDLDTFLKRKYNSQESRVHLGSIMDIDGSVPEESRNKIIMTLINIEQETTVSTTHYSYKQGNTFHKTRAPLRFNLDLVFSGLFNQYNESLKFISDTILFFQAKPFFNAQNSPGLPEEVNQLSLEVLKYNLNEMHSLWTSLGVKYIPSVPFKLRLMTFQSEQIIEHVAAMQTQGVEVLPQIR